MTQTILEASETVTTLSRRRELPSAPVLIRVPVLAAARITPAAAPSRRRRLRREVRLAGAALLLLAPTALIAFGLGSGRLGPVAASALGFATPGSLGESAGSSTAADPARHRSTISLSIEPVLAGRPARDFSGGPVLLSGQLLPVDTSEEPSHHGGH